MKYRTGINYTFLLLALGIVSTILSNPILAQTAGTAGGQQSQPSEEGQQQGGNQTGGPLAEVGEAIGKMFQQGDNQTGGQQQQQQGDNQTGGQQQQQQQGDNQTGGQQQQQQGGNQTEGIGSIEELEKLTAPPNVTQKSSSLAEGLEKSQTGEAVPGEQEVKFEGQGNQTGGQQQQQQGGNQTGGQQQQQQGGNQTGGQQQQQQGGNQTGGQEGNQTGGPLEEVGEAIGKLFQ
jgi:hypothetical protein